MQRWHDPHSGREVWLLEAAGAADWPRERPWSCASFGLLVAADHAIDAEPIAERAVADGVAFVCTWGPGCSMVEETVEEVIADSGQKETAEDVVLTTSHAYESLEEALEFFLDAATPSRGRAAACAAWFVFAVGSGLGERFERALRRRGATPD